jgi:hypothetical protein
MQRILSSSDILADEISIEKPTIMGIFQKRLLLVSILGLSATALAQYSTPVPAADDSAAPAKPPATAREDYDPLLDPPPLPHNRVTLMGGTVTSVNEIQNRITVKPFGGKQRLRMDFDMRTHIFLDGETGSGRDLKVGQRVYLDTMLNSSQIFAKNIWIRSGYGNGNARGQILDYDGRTNILTLRDEVASQPVHFRLDPAAVIHNGTQTGSVADLKPGSLVEVSFDSGKTHSGVVRELSLLATPGSSFTFLGTITYIDVSQKLISVANQNDGKNYDIYFESLPSAILQSLHEGSEAAVSALFDGRRYVAQKVDVVKGGLPNPEDK